MRAMREPSPCVWSILLVCLAATVLADDGLVTCGSVVKLQHGATTHLLHSQEVSYQYGSGSGQQSVTGYNGGDDFGSYWMVALAKDVNCSQGEAIKHQSIVRLQHQATRRWLHSHHFQSPLTRKSGGIHQIVDDPLMRHSAILVFANKQDMKGAMTTAEICESLGLAALKGRKWHVQGSIAIRGEGLYEGLDWLANTLKTMQRTGVPTSVSAVGR